MSQVAAESCQRSRSDARLQQSATAAECPAASRVGDKQANPPDRMTHIFDL
jgi:hypothetical protein